MCCLGSNTALRAYLQSSGIDVTGLEEFLDDDSLWFILYVCKGCKHDGSVARLVLLVDVTQLWVEQQAHYVHVAVGDSVVQRRVTLSHIHQVDTQVAEREQVSWKDWYIQVGRYDKIYNTGKYGK